MLWPASPAGAADPQPYDVTIDDAGSQPLNAAIRASSLLSTLRNTAPVSPFGLILRARQDTDRLDTVLQGFGYYAAHVTVNIDGHSLDDPTLPAILDALPAGRPANLAIQIDPGPLYRLRRINVDGMIPADAVQALKLSPGDPAIAGEILAARARLLSALQEDGYPLADVEEPAARADDDAHVLDLTFNATSGQRAVIGDIRLNGLKTVNEDFARRAVSISPGEQYRSSTLETARQSLLRTGVFAGVVARPGDAISTEGSIPILFDVEERPLHAVNLDGSYSTDLGVMLSAGWSHRNLFGSAEQLNLTALGNGLWGNATQDIGYQLSAQFLKPDFLVREQTLELDAVGLRQDLIAYKQTSESALVRLNWTFPPLWSASAGASIMNDDVHQEGLVRTYQIFSVPLTLGFDSTGLTQPLLDPTRGFRASMAFTPAEALGTVNTTFFILQAGASSYFDLFGDGQSVIAARALLGAVFGAANLDLPPDQRLYAGGSTTVRGYRYQSIGPQFPNGNPVGGTAVDAGALEFRQRIFADWGIAAFIDAGQASARSVPFTGTLHAGAGGGIRYYTQIGAVRADIAVPLNSAHGADAFEVYVGLGQAF